MTNAKRDYGKVYACAKAAGMDEDTRRDFFQRLTGKRSLSLMSVAEVRKCEQGLQALAPKRDGRRKAAPRADLKFVHVLWRLLGDAEVLMQPGRAGLNAFVQRRFGETWGSVPADIDMLRDARQIASVIEALKDWCERAGVELEARD